MWTGMKYSALPEYDLYEPSGKELALTCNFWKCAGELRHTWPLSNQKKCQPFLLVSSGTRGRSLTKKCQPFFMCGFFRTNMFRSLERRILGQAQLYPTCFDLKSSLRVPEALLSMTEACRIQC